MSGKVLGMSFIIFLMMLALVLVSCEPHLASEGTIVQLTRSDSINGCTLTTLSGSLANVYTEPVFTSTPKPWQAFLVTPMPGKIQVGPMTDVTNVPPPANAGLSQYSLREEFDKQTYINKLYVRDSASGREFRLGSDDGTTGNPAISGNFVAWQDWRNEGKGDQVDIYAYNLNSHMEITVANRAGIQMFPRIAGEWVIYVDFQEEQQGIAGLYAHNLMTGEDFAINGKVPFRQDATNGTYHAISGNYVAWLNVPEQILCVYDLKTRTTRGLNIPGLRWPTDLSLSGDILVWLDAHWLGYDLTQDAMFVIPIIPQGVDWEEVFPASTVSISNDQLYWSLRMDGKVHNFTAPIIRDK